MLFKATLLLSLLAVALSIDVSCTRTGNFGFLPEVITDCLTGDGGAMSLSVYYQITLAGSGNSTVS
jgi:predicted permease